MKKEDKARWEELQDKLSPKEKLFVESYCSNGYNAAEATRQAGYATKYPNKVGSQNLARPRVKEAIRLLQADKMEAVTVSPDYVLRKLVKPVEAAESEGNHTATLRGLELMAKHLGMFIERTEISGRDGEAIQYEKVSNDAADFARTIASLARRGGAREVSSDSLN